MDIWSKLRRGITPEINAVGAIIILVSSVLTVISVWLLREPERK
jgi:spermidine/putrescine transport system permease protein